MKAQRPYTWFPIVNHVLFILLCLAFLIPLWAIIAISLSDEVDIVNYGYSLLPRELDFGAYSYLFEQPLMILNAYKVTILMSVAGTCLSLFMISTCAYALSRKDFAYRKWITFYLFFTMLFNGGLVPFYILMTKYMHMQNTYAALIIPLLAPVWYLLIVRTFFQQLPQSLIESATIDGAKEWRIYISIILPLSKPAMATVGLMQLLQYWNSWYQALLFISDKDMYPLQYLLQVTLNNLQEILRNMEMNLAMNVGETAVLPSETIRMAMAILAIGPMLVVYPFFQKYFAKGLTIGSVKE